MALKNTYKENNPIDEINQKLESLGFEIKWEPNKKENKKKKKPTKKEAK